MITRRQFNATASAPYRSSATTVGPTPPACYRLWHHRALCTEATDVIGRIVGEQLSKTWGQQVVIENRPRRYNIANELVAHSDLRPTFMGGVAGDDTTPSSLNYDPMVILLPLLSSAASRFHVRAESLPVKSVREFVAYARQPGQARARLTDRIITTFAPSCQAHGRIQMGMCVSWRLAGDETTLFRSRASPLLRWSHTRQCESARRSRYTGAERPPSLGVPTMPRRCRRV